MLFKYVFRLVFFVLVVLTMAWVKCLSWCNSDPEKRVFSLCFVSVHCVCVVSVLACGAFCTSVHRVRGFGLLVGAELCGGLSS